MGNKDFVFCLNGNMTGFLCRKYFWPSGYSLCYWSFNLFSLPMTPQNLYLKQLCSEFPNSNTVVCLLNVEIVKDEYFYKERSSKSGWPWEGYQVLAAGHQASLRPPTEAPPIAFHLVLPILGNAPRLAIPIYGAGVFPSRGSQSSANQWTGDCNAVCWVSWLKKA